MRATEGYGRCVGRLERAQTTSADGSVQIYLLCTKWGISLLIHTMIQSMLVALSSLLIKFKASLATQK